MTANVTNSPDAVVASDGVGLPMASLAQAFANNGSGQVTSITVVYNGNTYVQTFTYTGGFLTNISRFVKS